MLDVKEEEEEEDREEVKFVFRNHEPVLVLLLLLLLLLLYSALESCSTDRTPTMLVAPTPNSRRLLSIRNIFFLLQISQMQVGFILSELHFF